MFARASAASAGLPASSFLSGAALAQQRRVVALGDRRGIERERLEAGEPGADLGVGQAFGVQLLVEVAIQAELADARDVLGAGAESRAVEDVDDRGVVERRRPGLRDGARRRQQEHAGDEGQGGRAERGCNHGHVSSTSFGPSRSWTGVPVPRLKKLQRLEPVSRRDHPGAPPELLREMLREMHREAYRNARRMTRAALRPGAPMMPPPGWAEEPQR